MNDLPDNSVLDNFLDPRGDGWKLIDPIAAGSMAARIKYVMYDYDEPVELIALRCQEINKTLDDPDMYVAVFRFLSAPERRMFKAYCLVQVPDDR